MSRIVFFLILIIALVNGQNDTTNGTTSSTTPSTTTTTTITTTIVTNSTTTEPTTNSTTTTPAPTTSTVPPTTSPTPIPTVPPTPSPQQWSGNVTKDNNTCILVQFKVQITITYNTTKDDTELTTKFNIPINATVDLKNSYCSLNATQLESIVIDFVDEELTSGSLTLIFNNATDEVVVEEVELSYNLTQQLFPSYINPDQYNKMVTVSLKDLKLFGVAKKHSYACNDTQTVTFVNNGTDLLPNKAIIDFTDSKVEAYIDASKKGQFDSEINCATTKVSDVVPIAVGAALAGLVIIVLIAYFIGRRRSRRLAYQSV